MASFPTSTKSFTTLVDLADSVLAAHQNQRGDEITAIENYLREAATEVSVSGGVLTVTKSRHTVQPESGTRDDIDTIDGMPDNTLLILTASDAGTDTLVFKHGTGNLSCHGGMNISISDGYALCYYDGTTVFVMAGGGTPSVPTIMEGLQLTRNSTTSITVGVGRCYAENGDLIDVASALTASSLSLSADTWYHVYVYLNAGTPAVEVVTTAPAAWKGTAYSKTGATDRRYVGSVRADGSGNVLYFVHAAQAGQMVYGESYAGVLRVLNAGTATSETDVSCAALVPVTSRLALIAASNNSGAGGFLYLGSSGSDNVAPPTSGILIIADGRNATMALPVDGSQNISYAYNASAGSGGSIYVLGYYFDR